MIHMVKKDNPSQDFVPFDATFLTPITAESFVYYHTGKKAVVPCNNDTNAATFRGVCMDTEPVNISGVNTSPNNARNLVRVQTSGVATAIAKTGDAFNPFDLVYASNANNDYQTVTSTGGSHAIGFVDPEQTAITSATAGQLVKIRFRANYPVLPIN